MSKERSPDQEDIKLALRKLRKKLRQIESLEKLARPLLPDEIAKLGSKDDCRVSLSNFLGLAEQFDVSLLSETSGMASENVLAVENASENVLAIEFAQSPGIEDDTSKITLFETENMIEDESLPDQSCGTAVAARNDATHPTNDSSLASKSEAPEVREQLEAVPPGQARKRRRGSSRRVEKDKLLELKKLWSTCRWVPLDGHHDNICTLDTNNEYTVSGSKDTTCKVWNKTRCAVHTLGDHVSSVTAAFLFDTKVVTMSYDCALRNWDLASGKLEHSHYLYSPIVCGARHKDKLLLGTEGGKLIYYCTTLQRALWEQVAHEESLVSLVLSDSLAATAAATPDLSIWKVSDSSLTFLPHKLTDIREVRCMVLYQDVLYYGDDGVNIKIYSPATATLTKLRNHETDYGSTDALLIFENMLFSSSYNLDTGRSSINLRSIPEHAYLLTIHSPVYGPITALAMAQMGELYCGGHELGVIATATPQQQSEDIEVVCVHKYHEDYLDSLKDSSSSDDEKCDECTQRRKTPRTTGEEEGQGSWCSVS